MGGLVEGHWWGNGGYAPGVIMQSRNGKAYQSHCLISVYID
jgi:hypothetical protein